MAFLILLIILAAACIGCGKVIPQNHGGLITVMGKCTNKDHPLGAGFHLKLPFVEKIIVVDYSQANVELSDKPIAVTTKDQAMAYSTVNLTYHVTNAYACVWGNQNSVESMRNKVQAMFRDIIGGMSLNDALDSNDKIQAKLSDRIDKATNMYGLEVDQVNIEEIKASDEMQHHMAEQKQSQLDKISKKNEADGDASKIATVNKAQNDATVHTAIANATAAEKAADAKYYTIKKNADARQYSVNALKKVLAEVGDDPKLAAAYFNYLSINASQKLATSGNMVFDASPLNKFGRLPQMAAMQRVWKNAQSDEDKQAAKQPAKD